MSIRSLSRPVRRRLAAIALLALFTASLPGVWCQVRCATADGHHARMMGETAPCQGQQAVLSLPTSVQVAPGLPVAVVTLPLPLTISRLPEPEIVLVPTGLWHSADPPPPRSA